MSIPEKVENAAWHGNWQDEEETIHRILKKSLVGCSTQATNWQRIGNQIDAAFIFTRADFVIDKVMVQALMRWRAKPGPRHVVDIY